MKQKHERKTILKQTKNGFHIIKREHKKKKTKTFSNIKCEYLIFDI